MSLLVLDRREDSTTVGPEFTPVRPKIHHRYPFYCNVIGGKVFKIRYPLDSVSLKILRDTCTY